MFLDATRHRNPALVRTAITLHRDGTIPPNSYVIDLDTVRDNAATLAAAATHADIGLWFVVKQVGRNPEVIRAITEHIPSAAAIDLPEACTLRQAGARLGNLGHLVQPPAAAMDEVLSLAPDVVTVFDIGNARKVSAAASRAGVVQPVLLRVAGDPSVTYPGQEGGVPASDVAAFAQALTELPGVRLAGVTAFPCLLVDADTGLPRPTPTLWRLLRARDALHAAGHRDLLVSAPSVSCADTLGLLAEHGVTHAEPGHALTGSTPLAARSSGLRPPEVPAMVYVSEVAHTLPDGSPALFGGGFYPRATIRDALLTRDPDDDGVLLPVRPAPADNIDYYRLLRTPGPGQRVEVGDTAVLAFRTQIFVTRSTVVVLAGLRDGAPRLLGRYDPWGRPC